MFLNNGQLPNADFLWTLIVDFNQSPTTSISQTSAPKLNLLCFVTCWVICYVYESAALSLPSPRAFFAFLITERLSTAISELSRSLEQASVKTKGILILICYRLHNRATRDIAAEAGLRTPTIADPLSQLAAILT